jgi:hypothetical protein
MNPVRILFAAVLATGLVAGGQRAAAEMTRLGAWEVHHQVVATTFLKPDIADHYGVVRARDRTLLNIAVLGSDGTPVPVSISGTLRNLLDQSQPLEFREVREGTAIYYLAEFRHTDRETLRFAVDLVPPDGVPQRLEFQQQLYWDGR